MIKVFTLNKNNKIELTKKELEQLLNESYWEGYFKNNTYVYQTPDYPYWKYSITSTGQATAGSITTATLHTNEIKNEV